MSATWTMQYRGETIKVSNVAWTTHPKRTVSCYVCSALSLGRWAYSPEELDSHIATAKANIDEQQDALLRFEGGLEARGFSKEEDDNK